jgi:hypothetical protein
VGLSTRVILFINFLSTNWMSIDTPLCLLLLHYYQIAKLISRIKCFPEPACLLTSQNYPSHINSEICQLECLQTKAATQTYTVSTLWFTCRIQTAIQNPDMHYNTCIREAPGSNLRLRVGSSCLSSVPPDQRQVSYHNYAMAASYKFMFTSPIIEHRIIDVK